MNFLAHIYLSEEDPELKIGNFIADSVKGRNYTHFPGRIPNGITLHRRIDAYTDSHPVFRESIARLAPIYGRYSSVIIDIIYDHYLAAYWSEYCVIPLEIYVSDFYSLLQRYYEFLPKRVQNFLPYMIKDNWLLSYATIPGIGRILYQMNHRTKNISKMNLAVNELEQYYEEFEREFREFFKELQTFATKEIKVL